MKIENKEFWEQEAIILSQDKSVEETSNYEGYLYEKAKKYFSSIGLVVKKAKIFGCGTGREINGLLKTIAIVSVLGTDISENMIKKGQENIKAWGYQDKVTLNVVDASEFKGETNSFQLVTFMNCILTYVKEKEKRAAIFNTAYSILEPNGCVIGALHNQVGTPQKTFYFFLRRVFKIFLKTEVGNRITGFNGYDFVGYYYTKKGLYQQLEASGFKNIEIKSLSEFYKEEQIPYNRLKGYNNLIFFATK